MPSWEERLGESSLWTRTPSVRTVRSDAVGSLYIYDKNRQARGCLSLKRTMDGELFVPPQVDPEEFGYVILKRRG